MMMGRWLRRAALVLVLALLAGATLTARVVVDGERELGLSDAAFDQGDVRVATLHARRAAILYVPGAPHVGPAYERLRAIAVGAEAAGDGEAARLAWQAIRSASLETRHVFIPRAAQLEEANANLARLQAVGASPERARKLRDEALAGLQDESPRVLWIALLLAGFVIGAAGLGYVAWRGVTPDGDVVRRSLTLGLVLFGIGAACWTLAVLLA